MIVKLQLHQFINKDSIFQNFLLQRAWLNKNKSSKKHFIFRITLQKMFYLNNLEKKLYVDKKKLLSHRLLLHMKVLNDLSVKLGMERYFWIEDIKDFHIILINNRWIREGLFTLWIVEWIVLSEMLWRFGNNFLILFWKWWMWMCCTRKAFGLLYLD